VAGGAVQGHHGRFHRRRRPGDHRHQLGDEQAVVPRRHQQQGVSWSQGVGVAQRHLGAAHESGPQRIGQVRPGQRGMDLGG
jgi:hypothetical protein